MKFALEIDAPSAPKGVSVRARNGHTLRIAQSLRIIADSLAASWRPNGSFEHGDLRGSFTTEED